VYRGHPGQAREEAAAARQPTSERRLQGRTASRLALVGVACVLVLLAVFAVWTASSTSRATQQASRLTHLNDAYQRARQAATTEALLEREYLVSPDPEIPARFARAAGALEAAVAQVRRQGDDADLAPLRTLAVDHQRYVAEMRRLFAAADAGERELAVSIHLSIKPIVDEIQAGVDHGAAEERDETLAGLSALRSRAVVATPSVFAVGLVLLALFCAVLIGYQRRTEWQASENARQALFDGLTGLPNRDLLRDRTNQATRQADRELLPAALLLIDLDRFKEVNDTLGHHYGDQLLVQVGERLGGVLRKVDTIARLGGDEFAVLLPRIATSEGAVAVAKKLQLALNESFLLDGLAVDVEASVGLVLYPDHGQDADELLRHADIAMYVAKEKHTGFMLFDPKLDQHSPRRLALLGELRRAIERGELVLHYQPKVEAGSGQLLGVEALVRWEHPEHGIVAPGEFIPLAERTGLITPLTHYVLDMALHQCQALLREGRELAMAVNVSARRLLDLSFPDEVAALLATWDVPARLLIIEITESTIMTDPIHAMEILGRLNGMGVQISIDDFGTGYSSMSYLKSLPVDELKIDRSFVSHMTASSPDAVIVRSTVDLGRNLGLRVVAEGVEDLATWDELKMLGCDAIQGYHVSRPLPPADLVLWLDRQAAPA
jgi:diguanylate cyclase (GGDEF)-like protein